MFTYTTEHEADAIAITARQRCVRCRLEITFPTERIDTAEARRATATDLSGRVRA
jgi:hypothetical protein